MKRTIEIAASFTGTIPTGNYQNEKPFYSVKEILELDEADDFIIGSTDELIEQRQKQLHDMCYNQFRIQAEAANAERIANTYKNIRFYDGERGLKYPSVTSIIDLDKDFCMPEDELAQYGCRGTVIHKQIETFLLTGQWVKASELAEVSAAYLTVKRGNLGLDCENTNFRAFYKDYPFKVVALEQTILSHKYRYGGRMDILCIIESTNKGKWDKIEGVVFDVPTILDIKTGSTLDKMSGLIQQSAYAKGVTANEQEVKQIGLIHLTKDNKCGFAKPVIETNIERYWNLFLNRLETFRQRYGV